MHTHRLLTNTDAEALAEVLATQQRLIEEVLFRTLELTALIEAGQHRFLGRALDDLERAELALGEAEIARAAITEAMVGSPPGHEPSLADVLATVEPDRSEAIDKTAGRIRATLAELTEVRAKATTTADERVARTRRAMRAASSEAGLYEPN